MEVYPILKFAKYNQDRARSGFAGVTYFVPYSKSYLLFIFCLARSWAAW